MSTEKDCITKLLNDDPAVHDNFGPHEKVAAAILELICKEEGGKSIGLTGSWGSGKSTVVKLLEQKLPDKTEMFIFDAWAHEGDPLSEM